MQEDHRLTNGDEEGWVPGRGHRHRLAAGLRAGVRGRSKLDRLKPDLYLVQIRFQAVNVLKTEMAHIQLQDTQTRGEGPQEPKTHHRTGSGTVSTRKDLEVRLRSTESQLENHTAALEVGLSVSEEQLEHLKAENTVLSIRLNEADGRLLKLTNTNSDLEVRLRSTESQLENHTAALEVGLSVSEEQLEHLKAENTVQSVQLNSMESRLTDSHNNTADLEVRLRSTESQLENHTAALEVGLSVSEEQLEHLKAENTVQSVQLNSMESRLTDSHNNTADLEVRLRSTESQLENHTAALEVGLSVSEEQLEHLKAENTVQSVQLNSMESRLTDSHNNTADLEVRLRSTESQLENHTAALEVGLSVSEEQLEHLKAENTVQSVQLNSMESRLTDSHNNTAALEVRLRSTESRLEGLKAENKVLSIRLNEADGRLLKLTNTNSDELKVAFSAGLTDSGSVGPFDEETTLIFSKTITNIGRGYNQTAGVFTAPVRGLYFFSFTAADYLKGYMGLYLYRNNQPIIFNLDLNDHGGYASTSNGVALQLEEGDRVRLSLPASYRLYDDSRNFSVFSGFLLFPL
ncbi:paramyosin-like [Chaetodon trifascialis]|uniref:paramyosin-like n=1 Tax=Chaetodon trifascialis TaxID=109706 RepID=UPI003993EADC